MKSKLLSLVLLMAALATGISCQQGRTSANPEFADTLEIADTLEDDSLLFFQQEDDGLSMDENTTEVFTDFIFAFTHNGRFQAEHIKFPLPVVDEEGMETQIRSGRQFRETFQLPGNDYFTMILGDKSQMDAFQNDSLTHVNMQYISLGNSNAVCYHFQRTDGRWALLSRRTEPLLPHIHDFLEFYQRFITDSIFQQESLAKELVFAMDDPEEEDGDIEGTIDASQWPMFRPDMPAHEFVNFDFGQTYPHPDRIYFMQCGISNGMLDTFSFRHSEGRWKLTAYEN